MTSLPASTDLPLELAPDFRLQPAFLSPTQAQGMLETLWRELAWKQHRVTVFGRRYLQPRLTAWQADPGVSYTYSGLELSAAPWHPLLDRLRRELQVRLDAVFNSVLVNAYRDGNDAMGWHADDEPELGVEPVIASLSLGASRRFLVRPKKRGHGGRASRGVDLGHGDLLLMRGRSQADWQHSISRTKQTVGLRINLTFRRIH